ncbi:hypothetical protein C1703_03860 [Streptomyces sp. Go-475]|nr:hypothetical protein C1703_03860 [Streptomyces sp. Go-475]
MVRAEQSILDLPHDADPDPDELVRAAMRWHFGPDTGSPFWLARAASLDFDPLSDVKTYDDLTPPPCSKGSLPRVTSLDTSVTRKTRRGSATAVSPAGMPPLSGHGAPWSERLIRSISRTLFETY